jgi:alkylation response protein AidB-like acyl-CoA dehydrogenase
MMPHSLAPAQTTTTTKEIVDRARAVASNFAAHTAAAEEARRISRESVQEMLAAGVARILVPPRFGGYGLDFDAWFDVVLEISKVDASHGWCASLIIHHAHVIGQFPEEAQQAVWAEGPDVAIAASFAPATQAIRVEGGYRVSGQNSTFASGVDHSSWIIVGGFVHEGGAPQWNFFLIHLANTKSETPGSQLACVRPVAIPSSLTMCLCRTRACSACLTCGMGRAREVR